MKKNKTSSSFLSAFAIFILTPLFVQAQIWEQLLDDMGGMARMGSNAMVLTPDSTIVLAGSDNATGNIFLAKTDLDGNTLWYKNLDIGDLEGWGLDVVSTSDTGLVITGAAISSGEPAKLLVIKTTSAGDILWIKFYTGEDSKIGNKIVETDNGGFIVAGHTSPFNGTIDPGNLDMDIYLMGITAEGDLLWEKEIGEPIREDRPFELIKTKDGNYIAGCYRHKMPEFWIGYSYLIKVDADGNAIWESEFRPDGNVTGQLRTIAETNNGEIIIAGVSSDLYANENNFYVAKTDSLGQPIWISTFGDQIIESFSTVMPIENREIIAGGLISVSSQYQGYFARINSQGEIICDELFPSVSEIRGYVNFPDEKHFIAGGLVENAPANYHVNLSKFHHGFCMPVHTSENQSMNYPTFSMYPNPAHTFIKIETQPEFQENWEFTVADIIGRVVLSEKVIGKEFILQRNSLGQGLYTVYVFANGRSIYLGKILFE